MKLASLKFFSFCIVVTFLFSACEKFELPAAQPSASMPEFRKDGEVWLTNQLNFDTLIKLDVEYAITNEEISRGLMHRMQLAQNSGLLFLLSDSQVRNFWMKNTYISLDIIFIDDKNKVVSIQKNTIPLSLDLLSSIEPAMSVLEVNGGLSDKIGLKKGDCVIRKDLYAPN
jgi:uncharacterized membrane protein (UPF0127 family)